MRLRQSDFDRPCVVIGQTDHQGQTEADTTSALSKGSSSGATEVLSPTALVSSLMNSYETASDTFMAPFSPFSQADRLGFISPEHMDSSNRRSRLSPPGSDILCRGSSKDWLSPSSLGMGALEDRFLDDATERVRLLRSPMSPPHRVNANTNGNPDAGGSKTELASPIGKNVLNRTENAASLRSESCPSGTMEESIVGGRKSSGWRVGRCDGEMVASSATEADAAAETCNNKEGAGDNVGQRSNHEVSSDFIGCRHVAVLEGDASVKGRAADIDRHCDKFRLALKLDKQGQGLNSVAPGFDAMDKGPAASRASCGAAVSTTDSAVDDTPVVSASLVSFQKPRIKNAPRIKGPLGTNALRVTLGTPVAEIGTSSIGSYVKAKLSLPRTAPTPAPPAVEIGVVSSGRAAAARGREHEGCSNNSSGGGRPEISSLKKASTGSMFDAVSPAIVIEENGTPYSVSRVGRDGRPEESHGQDGVLKEVNLSSGLEQEDPGAAVMKDGDSGGGGKVLCHTPMKPARRACTSAGHAASGERWVGPCATPPALTTGTPCSGSRFRSAGDEESDYSDYEEVRPRRKLFGEDPGIPLVRRRGTD